MSAGAKQPGRNAPGAFLPGCFAPGSVFAAALAGALTGVAAAATVLMIAAGGTTVILEGTAGSNILLLTLRLAGPGAFVLGLPLAAFLRVPVKRGRGRGVVLLLGFLAGTLLGLLNLAAIFLALMGADELPTILKSQDPPSAALLAAATAGGGSLGLVCAWWISRPEPEDVP